MFYFALSLYVAANILALVIAVKAGANITPASIGRLNSIVLAIPSMSAESGEQVTEKIVYRAS